MKFEKLGYTLNEAAEIMPISRAMLYRLAGEGRLEIRCIGKRAFVTAEELKRLLDEAPHYSQGTGPMARKGAA